MNIKPWLVRSSRSWARSTSSQTSLKVVKSMGCSFANPPVNVEYRKPAQIRQIMLSTEFRLMKNRLRREENSGVVTLSPNWATSRTLLMAVEMTRSCDAYGAQQHTSEQRFPFLRQMSRSYFKVQVAGIRSRHTANNTLLQAVHCSRASRPPLA